MIGFIKVDKETYINFLKKYGVDKWVQDFFMDWLDTYDFSLPGNDFDCLIARKYCGSEDVEYYIKGENENGK